MGGFADLLHLGHGLVPNTHQKTFNQETATNLSYKQAPGISHVLSHISLCVSILHYNTNLNIPEWLGTVIAISIDLTTSPRF